MDHKKIRVMANLFAEKDREKSLAKVSLADFSNFIFLDQYALIPNVLRLE
jgi:hypothetical protein